MVASGDSDGRIQLRDIRFLGPEPILQLSGDSESLNPIEVVSKFPRPNMHKEAFVDEAIWDIALGKVDEKKISRNARLVARKDPASTSRVIPQPAHAGQILTMNFTTGRRLTSIASDRQIRSFCTASGRMMSLAEVPSAPAAAEFFGDGLVCIGDTSGFHIYEKEESNLVRMISERGAHANGVTAVCAIGDNHFCTGGADGQVYIHSIGERPLRRRISLTGDPSYSRVINYPDGF